MHGKDLSPHYAIKNQRRTRNYPLEARTGSSWHNIRAWLSNSSELISLFAEVNFHFSDWQENWRRNSPILRWRDPPACLRLGQSWVVWVTTAESGIISSPRRSGISTTSRQPTSPSLSRYFSKLYCKLHYIYSQPNDRKNLTFFGYYCVNCQGIELISLTDKATWREMCIVGRNFFCLWSHIQSWLHRIPSLQRSDMQNYVTNIALSSWALVLSSEKSQQPTSYE